MFGGHEGDEEIRVPQQEERRITVLNTFLKVEQVDADQPQMKQSNSDPELYLYPGWAEFIDGLPPNVARAAPNGVKSNHTSEGSEGRSMLGDQAPPPSGNESGHMVCNGGRALEEEDDGMRSMLYDQVLLSVGHENGSGELPSLGGEDHYRQACRPCAFFTRSVCSSGYECLYCHYPHSKPKRPGKNHRKRTIGG